MASTDFIIGKARFVALWKNYTSSIFNIVVEFKKLLLAVNSVNGIIAEIQSFISSSIKKAYCILCRLFCQIKLLWDNGDNNTAINPDKLILHVLN